MLPKRQELPILQKAYDLALYLLPVVERMPRSHRFTLGERLSSLVYELIEGLTIARYTRDKAPQLQQLALVPTRRVGTLSWRAAPFNQG